MLKKTLAIILTISAILSLSACELFLPAKTNEEVVTFDVSEFTKVESEVDTTVDTTELATTEEKSSAEETTAITTNNTENTKSSDVFDIDEYTDPPLAENELQIAVPDFLDEDQQMLYKYAKSVYSRIFGSSPGRIEYDNETSYSSSNFYEHENGNTYIKAEGPYQCWDNFSKLILSIFTEDFWNQRKIDELYINIDGQLAFLNIVKGDPMVYNYNFDDEFELVSNSEAEIVFNVIGHYSNMYPNSNETPSERDIRVKSGWEATEKFTIRMVMTESGWRFDEFCSAGIDHKIRFYDLKK